MTAINHMLVSLGLGILLTGCSGKLSEKPAEVSGTVEVQEAQSQVIVNARVSFAALQQKLDAALPVSFEQSVGGGKRWRLPGIRTDFPPIDIPGPEVSLDYHATIHAHKAGPVAVARHGNLVRVSVPIDFDGQGGFGGDGARILGLDRKNFSGGVTAYAELAVDVDGNWCPVINSHVDIDWRNNLTLEIIGGVTLDIRGAIGPKISEGLAQIPDLIRQQITCDTIRVPVQREWKTRQFVFAGPEGKQVGVVLTPRRAFFSGVQVDDAGFTVALGLSGTSKMEFPAVENFAPVQLPLPALERVPGTGNRLALALPVAVKYSALQDVLRGYARTSLAAVEGDTPLGRAKGTVTDITVFPAGEGRLCLGVKVDVKFERRWLDVKGWVWVLVEPTYNERSQIIALKKASLTRELDNSLYSAVTALFKTPIEHLLVEKGTYDLKPQFAVLKARLAESAHAAGTASGMEIVVQPTTLKLKQLILAQDSLAVVVGLNATANVTVDAL